MTVVLDGLRVGAFGGIPGEVEIDLRAPLTVIYAPNGTGKTSLVEALSWAFDGECREPRCRLALDAHHTYVELIMANDAVSTRFKKSLRADGSESREIDNKKVPATEFLVRLAPDCNVSDLNSATQRNRLCAYLTSNRVLGLSTLSALIDPDNADARADAMADLLGTRLQRNAIKQLELYVKRLKDRRQEFTHRVSWFDSREQELLPRLLDQQTSLDQQTTTVLEHLGISEVPSTGDPQAALEAAAAEQRSKLRQDLEAHEKLAIYSMSELPSTALQKLLDEHAKAAAAVSLLSDELDELGTTLVQHRTQSQDVREEINWLSHFLGLLRRLLLIPGDFPPRTLTELYSLTQMVKAIFGDHEQASAIIAALEARLPRWREATMRVADIEVSLARIDLQQASMPPADLAQVELRELRQQFVAEDKAAQDFDRLCSEISIAAKALHEHAPDAAQCPACGHGWGNAGALRDALNRTAALVPASLRRLAARRHESTERIRQLETYERERETLRASRRTLSQELASSRKFIEETEELSARFSQLAPDPLGVSYDLSEWRARTEIAALGESIFEVLVHRSDEELDALAEEPIGKLIEFVDARIKKGSRVRDLLDQELRDLNLRRDELQRNIEEHGRSSAAREVRIRALRADALVFGELQRRFGISVVDDEALGSIRADLQIRRGRLTAAEAALTVRKREMENTRIRSDVESLRQQKDSHASRGQVVDREITRCERNIRLIDKTVEKHRDLVVHKLTPTVSELFQRMQVNRVFGRVECDSGLKLRGVLGAASGDESKLSPELFSQGQRQDLALAFFLVRAYALGGTFFLDEPLAHLDDLNRVALLDTLRGFVLSGSKRSVPTRLVITTASWTTARHVTEKFVRIDSHQPCPSLRVYQLAGNVTNGVKVNSVYPMVPTNGAPHIN